MAQETDRELLELAAKAAGIPGAWSEQFDCFHLAKHLRGPGGEARSARASLGISTENRIWWAPSTDDGDGARLEAALGITVEWNDDLVVSITKHHAFGQGPSTHGGDKQAARRLATLQVAAAIGKFGS